MSYIAAIDNGAYPRHEPPAAPGAKGLQVQVRSRKRAPGQQVNLVAHVRRPPCLAVGIDLVGQTGEFLERPGAVDGFDADVGGGAHGTRLLETSIPRARLTIPTRSSVSGNFPMHGPV